MQRQPEAQHGQRRRISPRTRASAVHQLIQGQSTRAIAASLGISVATAVRLRNEHKENVPPPRNGRPSKITQRTKDVLARQFATGQLRTLRDGQRFIQNIDGVQVHAETVRRNLQQRGIRAYVQQKRPNLKPKHVRERLAFARSHIHWTVEEWKNVIFSDESMISRIGSFGRKFYCSDHEHKRLLPHQIRPTPQGAGGKMMIWGCITYSGPGDLCRIIGSLNAELYLDVLRDYIPSTLDWYDMDPATSIFQQDNSSVHTANIVKNWLADQNFAVLEWPANSPDLNIIEHVWSHIKHQLTQYEQPPRTMNELWERVQDIWISIDLDFLHNLYESMPRRMEALLRSRGGPINY